MVDTAVRAICCCSVQPADRRTTRVCLQDAFDRSRFHHYPLHPLPRLSPRAAATAKERPAKRCYVGLVAVGVQEQAEDILVPPLLRNCLTLNDISCPSRYLPSRTVVLAIVFTV